MRSEIVLVFFTVAQPQRRSAPGARRERQRRQTARPQPTATETAAAKERPHPRTPRRCGPGGATRRGGTAETDGDQPRRERQIGADGGAPVPLRSRSASPLCAPWRGDGADRRAPNRTSRKKEAPRTGQGRATPAQSGLATVRLRTGAPAEQAQPRVSADGSTPERREGALPSAGTRDGAQHKKHRARDHRRRALSDK